MVYSYRDVEFSLPSVQFMSGNLEVFSWHDVVLWMRVEDSYEYCGLTPTYVRPCDKFRGAGHGQAVHSMRHLASA